MQEVLGPPPQIHASLSRYIIADALVDGIGLGYSPVENDVKMAVLNRASIITAITRPDLTHIDTPNDPGLSMLFTGDAYDQECEIRNTLAAWRGYQPIFPMFVDVLKVRV